VCTGAFQMLCNAADAAVYANSSAWTSLVTSCGHSCGLQMFQGPACATQCLHENSLGISLSADCATCGGQQSYCVATKCLVECAADSTTPDCVACADAACLDAFLNCSGIPPSPSDSLVGAPPSAPPPRPSPSASYAVKMAVVIAGDVATFTPEVLTPMRQKVADEASMPLDAVEATATAGSVTIAFTVNMQSEAAADTALAAITAKLADKTAASTFLSTAALTVAVEEIVAPTKLVLVSPPPPPAAPPPASPPADDNGVSVALMLMIVGGIAGGLGVVCLVMGRMIYLKKKKNAVQSI